MSAVIYYEDTGKIVKRYSTYKGAKTALTRARNSGKMGIQTSFGKGRIREKDIDRLAVCTGEYFNKKVDYNVEVVSIMAERKADGTMPTVTIRRSEEGGCTDPSTERYWTM